MSDNAGAAPLEAPMPHTREEVLAAIRECSPTGKPEPLSEVQVEQLTTGAARVSLYVLIADIRHSTFLMREAVDAAVYARILDEFIKDVRGTLAQNHGWFDKFTGDGFVAWWPYLVDAEKTKPVEYVLPFARDLLEEFEEYIRRFRRNSRNLPSGIGLSLGLDTGPAHLVMLGRDLTVVGSPIVGARRMVDNAEAGQMLANVYLGEWLERSPHVSSRLGVRVKRELVRTKEYADGQEAYRIEFLPHRGGSHSP